MLEIDRDDPREQVLVNLFSTRTTPQFGTKEETLVVPVFGRGRALEVIPAGDLSEGLIGDLTMFLCGACSCQVKDLNPGFDLLLKQDWELSLFGESANVPPPATTRTGDPVKKPILIPIPAGRSGK